MKTQSVVNTRLVEDKERLLLNFAFSLWFEKELEKVNSGSNAKKKKRYAALDPFKMVVEPPSIFKGEYFYACAADRPGGTLLVDKKVPYLTMETFLEKAKLSDKVNQDGSFNQDLADAVKNKTVSYQVLREVIASPDSLSVDPIYYITPLYDAPEENEGSSDDGETEDAENNDAATQADQTEGEGNTDSEDSNEETDKGESNEAGGETDTPKEYVVIFDSRTGNPDFDALVSWIFRDYTFEEIAFEMVEEGDADYPTEAPTADNPASFTTGKVTVKDSLLKEKSIEMTFIDLYLLSKTVSETIPVDPEDAEIVNVSAEIVTPVTPDAEEKVVGDGTVIITSAKVEDEDLILEEVMDDLGNDLSSASQLIIKENDRTKITTAIKLTNFPYAYSFPYSTGERRRLEVKFNLKGSSSPGQAVTIPVGYKLDNNSITPVIQSLDTSNGMSNAVIDLTFLDSNGDLVESVVPQTLGENYKMFADGSDATFLGDSTDFGKGVDAMRNSLKFNVALNGYGNKTLKFADPALKDVTYSIVDPNGKLRADLVSVLYTRGKLTLDYNLLKGEVVFETDKKRFSDIGTPTLTFHSTTYRPSTTWTKTGFTMVFDIGTGIYEDNVIIRGQLVVGENNVNVGFTNNIQIVETSTPSETAVIDTLALNGGYVYPGPERITSNVGDGSLIIISEPNTVKAKDLKLTKFIDALGEDITDKVETVFTVLNDDSTQFAISMTISDYHWPMSFDYGEGNGQIECEFMIVGNEGSAKSAKSSYKLNYEYEAIVPRPIRAQLTNNSLNRAKLFVAFYDNYDVFETGLEQNVPINPPLFGNSEVTYIGDTITYGTDDDNNFGAFIPVNFRNYGNFTLSFANTQFKPVVGSIADETGKYELKYYNEKFVDSGDLAIQYRLYLDNRLYSLKDGKMINDSIKVNIDSQPAKIAGIGWEDRTGGAGALLTVYVTLPEGTNKSQFDIDVSGQCYIGINNVGLDVGYSAGHAEV